MLPIDDAPKDVNCSIKVRDFNMNGLNTSVTCKQCLYEVNLKIVVHFFQNNNKFR